MPGTEFLCNSYSFALLWIYAIFMCSHCTILRGACYQRLRLMQSSWGRCHKASSLLEWSSSIWIMSLSHIGRLVVSLQQFPWGKAEQQHVSWHLWHL